MIRATMSAALFAAFVVAAHGALAQTAKTPARPAATPTTGPEPVSSDPASTSASYGDWLLRCQRVGEADKARRLCEVAQTIQLPNQPNPVAEIALGRPPGDAAMRLTAVLPASVTFPSSVQFATQDKPPRNVDLQWRRCLPGGCFADAAPSDDDLRAWRGATDAGRLTFKDAGGRDVVLPVSFRGLAQALDALGKS